MDCSKFLVDVVEPIEREIRKFAAGLGSVKDEQEYMMIRERTHRNTAESTNSRVKWWSILQSIVLFSVVGWQVWYLKVRLFSLPRSCHSDLRCPVFLRSEAYNLVDLYTLLETDFNVLVGHNHLAENTIGKRDARR